jgi:hypothetical protein
MKPENITQRNARLGAVVEPTQTSGGSEPPYKAVKNGARDRVEVVESYFGADGRPTKRKKTGAARVVRRYDEKGNKVEEAYYNELGQPMLGKGVGAARISWSYDASGKKGRAVLFAADGTPIEGREGAPLPEEA